MINQLSTSGSVHVHPTSAAPLSGVPMMYDRMVLLYEQQSPRYGYKPCKQEDKGMLTIVRASVQKFKNT